MFVFNINLIFYDREGTLTLARMSSSNNISVFWCLFKNNIAHADKNYSTDTAISVIVPVSTCFQLTDFAIDCT